MPQSNRRRVKILDYPMDTNLLICRCLPGQRDGSRRWFDFFTAFLTEKLQVEQCAEQPAMFRIPASDGGGVLLVHVDDVLFLAGGGYAQDKMMPMLKSAFKVSMSMAPRTGGSFFFLKREHAVEENYDTSSRHINNIASLVPHPKRTKHLEHHTFLLDMMVQPL